MKFHYHEVDSNIWQIYMKGDMEEHLCYIHQSKETARKVVQLLKSITNCQKLKLWNQETFKKVRRIIRIINRPNLYPIPFKYIEQELGYEIGCYLLIR
ncbi:MAG: hypothetical protein RIG88_06405, partial [Roseitalea porphyridii]